MVTYPGTSLSALPVYPVVTLFIVCSNWRTNIYMLRLKGKLNRQSNVCSYLLSPEEVFVKSF